MSKKKARTAKKAPKKAAARRSSARTATRTSLAATSGTTSQITIFLFRTGSGNKIRTSPQRAYAGPGHVAWTVVNLIDGTDVPVTITWPNGGPWGHQPLTVRSHVRESADGVKPGVYKYVVSALDAQEDPEVEFPQN
jgi:hypothetical protein